MQSLQLQSAFTTFFDVSHDSLLLAFARTHPDTGTHAIQYSILFAHREKHYVADTNIYFSSSLTTDSPCKLNICRFNCNTLRVDTAEICVLKQKRQVSLCSLLQSFHGSWCESDICLKILSYFPH